MVTRLFTPIKHILYYPNGTKYIEEYRINNHRCEINKNRRYSIASVAVYDIYGNTINTLFYDAGCELITIMYVYNGKLHNDYGPAFISWHSNLSALFMLLFNNEGICHKVKWYSNGLLHNVNSPAVVEFTETFYSLGDPCEFMFYQNGVLH